MLIALDLQHELYIRTMDGKLALCPKAEGAKRVLDMGTGTGMWAMDYGEPFLMPYCLVMF